MTQTIHFLSILAIAVILIGSISVGTVVVAADEELPISFSWDPADKSTDPLHSIDVNGAFTRLGLLSDTTTDVQGEIAGTLESEIENESTTMTEITIGTTTFTATAEAHSQEADEFKGTITIDGEEFSVEFEPSGDATILQTTEAFTTPTTSQTSDGEILTISGTVKMCNDNEECLEGFGIIRREVTQSTLPTLNAFITTDRLEAEVIGDDGLFSLNMFRSERIFTIP